MKIVDDLAHRFLLAIIASVVLSLSLAAIQYTPVSQRVPDSLYTSFFGLFMIYLIFAGPVYLTAGVLFSSIIDLITKQKGIETLSMYFMYIGWYSFAGILSTLLLLFFLHVPDLIESLKFNILGIIASLLYFHFSLLWRNVFKRKVNFY